MGLLKLGKTLELWIDQAPKVVLNEGYFRTMEELGVNCLSVMIEQSTRTWDPGWTLAQLERLITFTVPRNMEVVLTVWPYPDPAWSKAAFPWLRQALTAMPGKIAGIEGDLEMNWKRDKVCGIQGLDAKMGDRWVHRSSLDVAGDRYVVELTQLCDEFHCRAEATTFTEHAENGAHADVAIHMDRLKVQAYSICERNNKPVPFNHLYGPGRMQRFTLDRTWLVPGVEEGKIEVVCGLGAWAQKWPDHTVYDAMATALSASMEYDLIGAAYWSSKHLFKNTENSNAVVQFLKGLRVG